MSATTTTAATTPALNAYLPVLARLLMCGLFIWDGVLQLRNPAGTADYFASLEAKAATRAPHNRFEKWGVDAKGGRAFSRMPCYLECSTGQQKYPSPCLSRQH